MKHTISDRKKLAGKAHNQNCEVMLNPQDYTHIIFIDINSDVKIKSAIETHELTDMKLQLN